jgi:hypothetical protein
MAALPFIIMIAGAVIILSIQLDPLIGIGMFLAAVGAGWLANLLGW